MGRLRDTRAGVTASPGVSAALPGLPGEEAAAPRAQALLLGHACPLAWALGPDLCGFCKGSMTLKGGIAKERVALPGPQEEVMV